MDTMTTETTDTSAPHVPPAARSRARKVLALATDETRIASERTAAWLRLTGYAEAAGASLEVFLAVYVLPIRAGETLDQRMAEAERLAGMAGEAIGERDVAMLNAEGEVRTGAWAARKTRRR